MSVPHDISAEECALGAALLSTESAKEVAETDPADFYAPSHREIAAAIGVSVEKHGSADPVTVAAILKANGKTDDSVGIVRLLELSASSASSRATQYLRIVRERAVARRLLGVTQWLGEEIEKATDSGQILGELEKRLAKVGSAGDVPIVGVREVLQRTIDSVESGMARRGAKTGLQAVDRLIGGLRPTTLTVVGARPGMGKTSFALQVAANVADSGVVLMFSLEMGVEEIGRRLLTSHAKVSAARFIHDALNLQEIGRMHQAVEEVGAKQLFLVEETSLDARRIADVARTVKRTHGLSLVVVDYLQLLGAGESRRERARHEEIGEMSRKLKLLAMELDVPVVAVSQLSRAVEGRVDKRPVMSDLRESGSLEQDADLVLLLYRDEVYHPEAVQARGTAEVIVAKNRNGETGKAEVRWFNDLTAFGNLKVQDR